MLNCKKDLFLLHEDVSYLNNSYMSPNLKSVEMAGIIGVRSKNQPYHITPSGFFDPVAKLKETFAKVINVEDPNRIAVSPSVSYGLANVAANLKIASKKNIVLPAEQFPSNYYIWKKLADENNLELRIVHPPSVSLDRGAKWNQALIDAIDDDTLLIACGHVHWTDGTKFDLEQLRIVSDQHGALLIVDGSQSIGALPFDQSKIKADAIVCVGYKWLFGPYGISFSYFGEYFDQGKPIEENWSIRKNSDDFKNLIHYQEEYRPLAGRYDMGEVSNFITVPMMQTALEQVNAWGIENIQAYSENLISSYLNAFKNKGCLIEDEAYRCNHLLGIRLPAEMNIDLISEKLKAKKIIVSIRGNAIRIATSVYNAKKDMDKLLDVLYHYESV